MPNGMRPLSDDDPERDPEYRDALARYVEAAPDELSNEEKIRRANGALSLSQQATPPAPMSQPAAALSSMAVGTTTKRPEDMSPEELDAAVQAKLGPKANWNPRPAPTPEGEAQFNDIRTAARASQISPSASALDDLPDNPVPGAVLHGHGGQTGDGVGQFLSELWARANNPAGMLTPVNGPLFRDAPPSTEPPPASGAISGPPPPVSQMHGVLREPTVRVGHPADVRVNNAVTLRSAAPPVPSGDIPPGPPVGPASSVPPVALARAREVLGPAKERPDPLALALAASRGDKLIAGLTRAGGTAIGRGTGPGYDALDEGADRPLQELGLREQANARGKAETESTGPLSPMEQTVYGKLLAQAGVNLDPAMLAKLPAGKVRALIPDLEKMGALEATRSEKTAALEREKGRDVETNRHNKAEEGIARTKAAKEAGAGKPVPETEALKIVNQQKALEAIDKLQALHAKTGALESLSPVGDTAGNEYSDAVKALSSAVAAGAMPAGRETPGMMEEIARSMPTKLTSHERAKAAFNQLREQIRSNAAGQISAAKAGGYSPAQVQELSRLGDSAVSASGPDVLEERRAPDGRTLQKMSDGSIRVKP